MNINFLSKSFWSGETEHKNLTSRGIMEVISSGGALRGPEGIMMKQLETRTAWAYYMSNQTLRHAIEQIWAVQFSSVNYQIYDTVENEWIKQGKANPLNDLQKLINVKPNNEQTGESFKKACNISFNVTGDTYIHVTAIGKDAEALQINYIAPQLVTALQGGSSDDVVSLQILTGKYDGVYTRTRVNDGTDAYIDDNGHELIHIKNFQPDPNSPYGLSMISSAVKEIEQNHAAMVQNTSFINKGARPAGVITMPDGVMPQVEDKQSIIDRFKSFYAGGENAGNVIFLEGGKDFKELSVNNKDMDYIQMLDVNSRKIYLATNIPMPLVDTKTMTHSNYTEAKYTFYDMTIIPACAYFISELDRRLSRRYPKNKGRYRLKVNRREVPAIKDRLDLLSMESGVLSTNERRCILGHQPVGEDGDIIYIDSTKMPLGSDPMQIGMGNGGTSGDGGISDGSGKVGSTGKDKDKDK